MVNTRMEALTEEQVKQLERIEEKLDRLLRHEGILRLDAIQAEYVEMERRLDMVSRD